MDTKSERVVFKMSFFFLMLVVSILMLIIGIAIEYSASRQEKANTDKNDTVPKPRGRLAGSIMILGAFFIGFSLNEQN